MLKLPYVVCDYYSIREDECLVLKTNKPPLKEAYFIIIVGAYFQVGRFSQS